MQPQQSKFVSVLKQLLFKPIVKHQKFQRLWSRLHTMAIFGMNYGGGGLIETSGETWVLAEIVRGTCLDTHQPVVFDVGANIGDYSRLVRRLLPTASVFAFEPSRSVYQDFVARIPSEDGVDKIKPFNLGFSDAVRKATLYSYTADGLEASLLSSIDLRFPTQVVKVEPTSSEEIDVDTIDHFCEMHGVDHIDFLKLDVEGHELAILRGAQRMLSQSLISMIQFEFGPANIYSRTYFYNFWSMLHEQFDIFRIIPQGIVPITYYGEHREIFLTTNYLAIRKRDTEPLGI